MPDGTVPFARSILPQPRVLALGVNWFSSGSGGLDRVYHDLMQAMPVTGVQMRGMVLGPPDVGSLTGGRVVTLGQGGTSLPGRLWRMRRAIRDELRTGDIDIVASHFAMCMMPALDCLGALKLVVHFHGPWADESAAEGAGAIPVALKRAAERLVYRRADRVVVLSRAFARIAVEDYGVPEAKIRQVAGSVDIARFNPTATRWEARDQLGWPQDRRILFSVRRLARRMGLDRLIAAVAILARAEPGILLMIAGRGHMEAALRAQVAACGLSGHVRFLGFLPDAALPLAYRAAELGVIPTLALEGFGLTAAEALACGTPVIVTPVGALPEVVGPLSADLVFASTEPQVMADHLLGVLRGAVRLPDEHACRAYAQARFAASHAAAQIAALYNEVAVP